MLVQSQPKVKGSNASSALVLHPLFAFFFSALQCLLWSDVARRRLLYAFTRQCRSFCPRQNLLVAHSSNGSSNSADIFFLIARDITSLRHLDPMDFSDNDSDGATEVSVSIENLRELYETASELFTIKLDRVKNTFPGLNVTLKIFLLHFNIIKLTIPSYIALPFFLTNYDTIAADNFLAHPDKPFETCRAIWYYNIDRLHSFSRFYDNIRYNVILMVILWAGRIIKSESVDALCDANAGNFWYTYVLAWL